MSPPFLPLALALALPLRADSPGPGLPPFDPLRIASPAGTHALSIDPSDVEGAGPARYELAREGGAAWSGELPFTLLAAAVGDGGVVVGFASSEGQGMTGEHRVVALDPRGGVVLQEIVGRGSGYRLEGDLPLAVALDEEGDRFLVELGARVRVHRASTGERLGEAPRDAGEAALLAAGATPRLLAAPRATTPRYRRAPPASGPELPAVALAPLGSLALRAAPARPGSGAILAWALEEGAAHVVREEGRERGRSRVRIETWSLADRTPLSTGAIDLPFLRGTMRWSHVRGRRWLAAGTVEAGSERRAGVLAVDAALGTAEPLADLESEIVEDLAARPDGAFAVVLSESFPMRLAVHDAAGRRTFARESVESGDPDELGSAAGVLWLADGRLAVLDRWSPALHVLAPDGGAAAVVRLEELFADPDAYLLSLQPGGEGAVLLHDSRETLAVRADGGFERVPSLERRDSDLGRALRAAPDGTLWTSDGRSLFRVGPGGELERVVDGAPAVEACERPERIAFAPDGRVLCVDAATRAVHAWDPSGARIFVSEPLGAGAGLEPGSLAATPDGGVLVRLGWSGPWARLGADGARGRDVPLDAGGAAFGVSSARGWCWGWSGGLRRLDPEAPPEPRRRAEIARLPDGRWVSGVQGVAVLPDGSVALAARGVLALYDARGEPLASVALPSGALGGEISAGGGRLLVDAGSRGRFLATLPDLALARIDLPAGGPVALSPDGTEVRAVDALVLRRFALPPVHGRGR